MVAEYVDKVQIPTMTCMCGDRGTFLPQATYFIHILQEGVCTVHESGAMLDPVSEFSAVVPSM